jgi:hypothetical protein
MPDCALKVIQYLNMSIFDSNLRRNQIHTLYKYRPTTGLNTTTFMQIPLYKVEQRDIHTYDKYESNIFIVMIKYCVRLNPN